MKYIVVDDQGIECPIIFSELQKHIDIAGQKKVISAGFCRFNALSTEVETGIGCHNEESVTVQCWGSSVGLGKRSRKEDEELILKHNKFRS